MFPGLRPRGRRTFPLTAVFVLHVIALIAIRLFADADDFSNWDLIGFLNANAFPTLESLLRLHEVHLERPFSFPNYNTGAESALSLVVHRAMGHVSLYWSNVVVLVLYDAIFLLALGGLFRLVLGRGMPERIAWMLVAMSPVVLTFPATLAFNMQAFAVITLALLGCEAVLQSRLAAGTALLLAAFLCISQAYPLTFFLPLFCLVWMGSRMLVHAASARGVPARAFLRNAALLVGVLAVCVVAVESGSKGTYLAKAFGVVRFPLEAGASAGIGSVLDRAVLLLRDAVFPRTSLGQTAPGFAPFGLLAALAGLGVAALVFGIRTTATHPARGLLATVAWGGLVLFGYMPALFGPNGKSQRCFFGDVFLVMAVATLAVHLIRRHSVRVRSVMLPLAMILVVSDAWYLSSVLGVDHSRNHEPVFDFDRSDGVVRHDMISAIDLMRESSERDGAGLIVYYPAGRAENRTDPALFHARFLRHFGAWQDREDVLFPCRFCSVRYGCPFPEVRKRSCSRVCCYTDPLRELTERPRMGGRTFYLWWFRDAELDDELRQSRVLAAFRRKYRVEDLDTPVSEKRWHVWKLVPRGGATVR